MSLSNYICKAPSIWLMVLSTACGTIAGNPKKPRGGQSPTAIVSTSVDDEDAQKHLVALQTDHVIAAISDGTQGDSEAGGTAIGLTDDPALWLDQRGERRHCSQGKNKDKISLSDVGGLSWVVDAGATVLTIDRTFSGKVGKLSYDTNADSSESAYQETWYPGPFFGLANIKPDSATAGWGNVQPPASGQKLTGIPYGTLPATPPAGSSGALGSSGWRSTDGSWTGAPVWEAGSANVPLATVSGLAAGASINGLVMYNSSHLPTFSCSSDSGKHGAYCVEGGLATALAAASSRKSDFSVLGYGTGDKLPAFAGDANGAPPSTSAVQAVGTITAAGIPARMYNPPVALTCDSAELNSAPGWRFSQNVAGLTRNSRAAVTYHRHYGGGDEQVVIVGNNTTTWHDPAKTSLVSGGGAYFDQHAAVLTVERSIAIGTGSASDTVTTTFTPSQGQAGASVTNQTETTVPVAEVITRSLSKGWPWLTRNIVQGTIRTTQSVAGSAALATAETTFKNLVFTNGSNDDDNTCVPTSGTIITVITPADASKQLTTITLKFGTSAGVPVVDGVSVTVECSGGAAGANNCKAKAETSDADYRPSGCRF